MRKAMSQAVDWHTAVRVAFRPTRRNALHWATWTTALGLELALVVILWDGRVFGWEQTVARELQGVPGKRAIFDVTSTLTNTLSPGFGVIFLVLLVAALVAGERIGVALMLLSFPLHVAAQFPKAIVDRERPSALFEGIEGVGGPQSFPSGHSEYVVTFYGLLAYLVVRRLRARWQRGLVLGAWIAFVLATGFGRVAEGRHWPVDVLASYAIGLGLLSGLVWLHTALSEAESEAGKKPLPFPASEPAAFASSAA